ncbi:MAG: 16S rRNA (cytidine(1402)-2'-O)-methyltransferase, partial [Pseudomonadota bacterium]
MLYLVATPIGNVQDITVRALGVLQSVTMIACEDSRKTGQLLAYHNIKAKLVPCHEHNEMRVIPKLIAALQAGEDVALVSDAGMPAISDPGYMVVREAIAYDIPMTSLPGANAVLPALQLSGLAVHSFTFRGFAPRKSGKRKSFLQQDIDSTATLIYY